MKKWLIPLVIIGIIVFAVFSMAKGFYNTSVDLEENYSWMDPDHPISCNPIATSANCSAEDLE